MSQILCVFGNIPDELRKHHYSWNNYLEPNNITCFDTPEYISTENLYCYSMKMKNSKAKNIYVRNNYIFVWDGDIYDRKKIYNILSASINTERLSMMSDIELVAELYIGKGAIGFNDIVGDYAVCIIDKIKNDIYCYRAPFGLRSLYYYYDEQSFLCCTSLDIIIKLKKPSININSEHFQNYLLEYLHFPLQGHMQYTPYDNTFILRHCYNLYYYKNKVSSKLQWLPKDLKINYKKDDEYVQHFEELFEKSLSNLVNSQPNRPWLLSLSGGLDSSSIACVWFKLLKEGKINKKATLFHYRHLDRGDELKYAQAIADYVESELNILPPSNVNHTFDIENIKSSHVLPSCNLYVAMEMSSDIFSHSSITMAGIGGDHILTGHIGYLYKYFKNMQFVKMFRQAKKISEVIGASLPSVLQAYALHSKKNYNNIYVDKNLIGSIYTDDYSKLYKKYLTSKPLSFNKIYTDPVAQGDYIDLMTADQWTSSNSTFDSVRSPFLNTELVQFCLSLPGHMKNDGRKGKIILREYMSGLMPDLVTNRLCKSDHGETFRNGLKNNWKTVENIIKNNVLEKNGILKNGTIQKILYSMREGTVYDLVAMMRIVELEMWLQLKIR